MAALAVSQGISGEDILIIEKNDRLGRKILATGNGRCNCTNAFCSFEDYHCTEAEFPKYAIESLDPMATIALFQSLGLLTRTEEEGRIYPYTGQAVSLQNALEIGIKERGINSLTKATVVKVEPENERFRLLMADGTVLFGIKVIIATGGKAGSQYGSTGDGYGFAKAFGHTLKRPLPALVQLRTNSVQFRNLKGVRAKGRVTLTQNRIPIAWEQGEIQFTEDGLSGICIFDLSRYYQPEVPSTAIKIDFFPDFKEEELYQLLRKRRDDLKNRKAVTILDGMLHPKLAGAIIEELPLSGSVLIKEMEEKDLQCLVESCKGWEIPIHGTRGWQDAQVTAGGIRCDEVNPATLESKRKRGLYFAGEVLDVEGKCGGWNLQWAWSSGHLAGRSAAEQLVSGKED